MRPRVPPKRTETTPQPSSVSSSAISMEPTKNINKDVKEGLGSKNVNQESQPKKVEDATTTDVTATTTPDEGTCNVCVYSRLDIPAHHDIVWMGGALYITGLTSKALITCIYMVFEDFKHQYKYPQGYIDHLVSASQLLTMLIMHTDPSSIACIRFPATMQIFPRSISNCLS